MLIFVAWKKMNINELGTSLQTSTNLRIFFWSQHVQIDFDVFCDLKSIILWIFCGMKFNLQFSWRHQKHVRDSGVKQRNKLHWPPEAA